MTNLENVSDLSSEEMHEIVGGGWFKRFITWLIDILTPTCPDPDPYL
jgi:hypothetical protein